MRFLPTAVRQWRRCADSSCAGGDTGAIRSRSLIRRSSATIGQPKSGVAGARSGSDTCSIARQRASLTTGRNGGDADSVEITHLGINWRTGRFSKRLLSDHVQRRSSLMTASARECTANTLAEPRELLFLFGGAGKRCAPGSHWSMQGSGNGTGSPGKTDGRSSAVS